MKTLGVLALSISLICCTPIKKNDTENKELRSSLETVSLLQEDKSFDFENYEINKIPSDWSQYLTGRGDRTDWKVIDDNGNKVLAQLSDKQPNYHFNEIVFNDFKTKNVELSVRMKGVTGNNDQGGGFVWRFIDADNYYVVRANPLEDNVVLYKVVNGDRTDLPVVGKGRTYGVDVPKLGNKWNDLKLIVVDDLFTVYLNGKEIFKVKDKTFTQAGRVGLWTKSDAVTYFDDFQVKTKSN